MPAYLYVRKIAEQGSKTRVMKKLSTKHRCLVESFFITRVKLTFHSPVAKGHCPGQSNFAPVLNQQAGWQKWSDPASHEVITDSYLHSTDCRL